jgi:hydrogenase nickel incorporation protein HypA/HybF
MQRSPDIVHEFGIANEAIEICVGASGDARITRVVLEIGKLSAVLPDAVRFCFDAASEGTVAQGAELEIIEVPGDALRIKAMEVNGQQQGVTVS